MTRSISDDAYLPSKYGKNFQPWECFITMPNANGDSKGGF